jgi:acetylglutamate kinase
VSAVAAVSRPLVLKFGGELLETAEQRSRVARLARTLVATRSLVIVHGGGRAIDAELKRRAITPKKVDGLRITDAETLEAVIAVLAGSANTDLVLALVGAGVRAVGLTGVDAGFGRSTRTSVYRAADGQTVDLGFVGDPEDVDPELVRWLLQRHFVPVIASIGIDRADANVLNINADVMAARLAEALGDSDLVIAGGTAGVLDKDGRTIPTLDVSGIDALIESGTATAGMIAKLASCRAALQAGVTSIRLIDGRDLGAAHEINSAPGTTLEVKVDEVRG